MVAIKTFAALLLILAALAAASPASACPAGYVACGPACCPGK
ncbi:MAG: hypothetical protein WA702_03425 [Bradyrhizobium sp.]|jgi:hypothetical protein